MIGNIKGLFGNCPPNQGLLLEQKSLKLLTNTQYGLKIVDALLLNPAAHGTRNQESTSWAGFGVRRCH